MAVVPAVAAGNAPVFTGGPPAGSGALTLPVIGGFAALAFLATGPGLLQQASAIMSVQVASETRTDTAIQRRARRTYPMTTAVQ